MVNYYKTAKRWYNAGAKGRRRMLVDRLLAPVDAVVQEITGKRNVVSGLADRALAADDRIYKRNLRAAMGISSKMPRRGNKRQRTPGGGVTPGRTGGRGVSKRYRTKGYGPRLISKKAPKHRVPRSITHGLQHQIEEGGVLTDTENIYVGHATAAPNDFIFMFSGAIIRWLYNKADIPFTRWDRIDITAHQIQLFFRRTTGQVEEQAGATIITGGALDHISVARLLQDRFEEALASSGTSGLVWDGLDSHFTRCLMSVNNVQVAEMNFQDATFNVSVKSELRVQNRTLADHDVGLSANAAQASNVDHVENNPLIGMRYRAKGKGFLPREQRIEPGPQNANVGVAYGANNNHGLITATNLLTNDSTKVAPPSTFQGVKYAKKLVVQPGEIINDVIYDTMRMKANQFISRFAVTFRQNFLDLTSGAKRDFKYYGSSSMFGLESLLNSRQTVEQPLSIAFELNRTTDAYISCRVNRVSLPIYSVNTFPAVQSAAPP
jgi:hypothetical protein